LFFIFLNFKMAIHKTKAIVLETKDYRETSYLLKLFTFDFGKINAQAKGARRKIGKFGTNFLLMSYNEIVFYENNVSDLHIISQADMLQHFGNIGGCLEKFTYAAYFLELVNTVMLVGEKNKEIFVLLLQFLNFLDAGCGLEQIRYIFEIKFLKISGFKPYFDCCVSCGENIAEKSKFSYVFGGLLCKNCFGKDFAAQHIMEGTIASVNYIEQMDLSKFNNFKITLSIRKQLEQILGSFIGFYLGRKFKSLSFLSEIRGSYV